MASDDVAPALKLDDLCAAEEGRLADGACGEEEVTPPAAFLQQLRDAGIGAHAPIVKSQKPGRALRLFRKLRDARGLIRADGGDGPQVLCEVLALKLVERRIRARKAARVPPARRSDIVIHDRTGSLPCAPRSALRFHLR